jgi:hypothetical protein
VFGVRSTSPSDVAQHRGAGLGDDRRADGAGDVVIARSDVGGQRAQGVERRLLAPLFFQPHIFGDLVHRDMPGAFDHQLHAMGFGHLCQLTQRGQLGELRFVVGVGDRPRPQPIAQREGHVVARQDLTQLGEVLIQERLTVMSQTPRRHDRPATGHDAGDPAHRQRDVAQQHPGVHGHVVHALLALLDHGVAVALPTQRRRVILDLVQRLIDRHRAHRHRRVAQDPLPRLVDVAAGGQIHDRVGPPPGGPHHLVDVLADRGGHRRIADVGVDLHRDRLADDHRLGLGMAVIGRDHGPSARHLVANQPGTHTLAFGCERHFRGNLPGPRPDVS